MRATAEGGFVGLTSVEVRTGEFAPTTGLRADTIGTPEPQSGGDERSHADGDECPTDHLHRGASWNRTSDLTLIRGAL